MERRRACFLFRTPTYLDGAAQVLNLSGQGYDCYRTSPSAREADRRALQEDWAAVGDYIRWSLREFAEERERRVGGGRAFTEEPESPRLHRRSA